MTSLQHALARTHGVNNAWVSTSFLLQGSTRLDQKAEELLKGLFDGVPWEFERWKKDDPQGYISQVGGVSTVHLSAGPTQLAAS